MSSFVVGVNDWKRSVSLFDQAPGLGRLHIYVQAWWCAPYAERRISIDDSAVREGVIS